MKAQYDAKSDSEKQRYPYESRWMSNLERLIAECDRNIERNRRKIAEQLRSVVRSQ